MTIRARYKRIADILVSAFGLIITLPFVCLSLLAVFLQDFHSPFYLAERTGKDGKTFKMVKIRSMRIGADAVNVWATALGDTRITPVGAFIRKCKFDEIPQLWNVLIGEMSLVGPRPLAPAETAVYTEVERHILDVTPGVTDIASLVLFNEEELLAGSEDPSAKYDQLIRPWKSRFALIYMKKHSLQLDCKLVMLTALAMLNRPVAIRFLERLLTTLKVEPMLIAVAAGKQPLTVVPPPGS